MPKQVITLTATQRKQLMNLAAVAERAVERQEAFIDGIVLGVLDEAAARQVNNISLSDEGLVVSTPDISPDSANENP